MSKEQEHYFTTRHARPARDASEADAKSKDYSDLTEHGVEQAHERARNEITDLIKKVPEKAVIFIGGASDQARTKQTAEIYGEALAASKQDLEQSGIFVITKRDIDSMVGEHQGIGKTIEKLREMIARHEGKVIIDYPLRLKELSYKNRWTDREGKKTEYFTAVLKKHNQNVFITLNLMILIHPVFHKT